MSRVTIKISTTVLARDSGSHRYRSVLLVSLLGFAPSAFAYLDPSTGSMILSAIIGIFATVGLALKTYWYKFKSFFKSSDVARAEANEASASRESDGK